METQRSGSGAVKLMAIAFAVILCLSLGAPLLLAAPANVNRFYGGGLSLATGGDGFSIGSDVQFYRLAANSWGLGTGDTLTLPTLTSGRVPVIGAGGLIGDDSDLTFSGDTLTATKIASGSITIASSSLTGATWVNSTNVSAVNLYANTALIDGYYPENPNSYTIGVDGATYWARDETSGLITINDATSLIQDCIDMGGTINIKNGVYQLNNALILREGTKIIGESMVYTILNQTNGSASILKANYTSVTDQRWIHLENLNLVGGIASVDFTWVLNSYINNIRSTSSLRYGFNMTNCFGFDLGYIEINNSVNRGMRLIECNDIVGDFICVFSAGQHAIELYDCSEINLHTDIESTSAAGYSLNLAGVSGCSFSGWIERGGDAAVHITSGSVIPISKNNYFSSLLIDNNAQWYGMMIENANYTRVSSSVTIQNYSHNGVYIYPTAYNTILEPNEYNVSDNSQLSVLIGTTTKAEYLGIVNVTQTVCTITTVSGGMYEVGGYLNVVSRTAGVLYYTVSYVDENSNARNDVGIALLKDGSTSVLFAQDAQNYSLYTTTIRAKAGTIIKLEASDSGFDGTYDVGGFIRQVG